MIPRRVKLSPLLLCAVVACAGVVTDSQNGPLKDSGRVEKGRGVKAPPPWAQMFSQMGDAFNKAKEATDKTVKAAMKHVSESVNRENHKFQEEKLESVRRRTREFFEWQWRGDGFRLFKAVLQQLVIENRVDFLDDKIKMRWLKMQDRFFEYLASLMSDVWGLAFRSRPGDFDEKDKKILYDYMMD